MPSDSSELQPVRTAAAISDRSRTAEFDIIIEIHDANFSPQHEFSPGEQIQFSVFTANRTDETISWRARHGRAFGTVIVEQEFPALVNYRVSFLYDQTTNDGGALAVGEYEVKVWLGLDANGDRLGSQWSSLVIL